jgi:tRNA dimethylallyltransferase
MTIGTGKDYADYTVHGTPVPYHCIDIVNAGTLYNVYEYQKDFGKAFADIRRRGKTPVLCGGSGMYIEAAVKGYQLTQVPVDEALRAALAQEDDAALAAILSELKALHNRSDIGARKRMIRAIEIARYQQAHPAQTSACPDVSPLLIGLSYDREARRRRITERLQQRLNEGMVEEVRQLLNRGLSPEQLEYYGLEYKYLTHYLTGKLTYAQLFDQLNTAIHQFAKRQMTWFRRMERNGDRIQWIDGHASMEEKMQQIDDFFGEET